MGFEFMFAKYLQIRIPRLSGHVLRGGRGGDGPRGPGDPRFECILPRFQIRGLRDPVGPFRERGVGAPEAPEILDLNLFC